MSLSVLWGIVSLTLLTRHAFQISRAFLGNIGTTSREALFKGSGCVEDFGTMVSCNFCD